MRNKSGFSVVEALLILIIVGIIGFTGWFVWNSQKETNRVMEDSVATDSARQRTSDKKDAPANEVDKQNTQKYLVIKEWSVKIPLSAGIEDAVYGYDDNKPNNVYLARQKYLNECSADAGGSRGMIVRFNDSTVEEISGRKYVDIWPDVKKTGGYYYVAMSGQAACTNNQEIMNDLNWNDFVDAVKAVEVV